MITMMGSSSSSIATLFFTVLCFLLLVFFQRSHAAEEMNTTMLIVDASNASARPIPDTMFGIFFEEINHAGAGGLWAELVSNRGFEAGGPHTPSKIDPWSIIGNDSSINVSTDRTSLFEGNKVALKLDVLCEICPIDGVGVSNPGFWGMNIEQGNKYKLILYVRSTGPINLTLSFTGPNGVGTIASTSIIVSGSEFLNWKKMENVLEAMATNHNSSLRLTTTTKGAIWLDQVSVMPLNTYKGHGFRNDLFEMMANLKPRFIRFPGGTFVEGMLLRNAFRWKDTIGAWEERPGHFNDVWNYWTDDGFGYFELLQLAEDLGALPVWVFNAGISRNDQVDPSAIYPFVQEALDGIEFARGEPNSKWGSIRASMGHSAPFNLKYVAVGNEDCRFKTYRENYLKFYGTIKNAYPDIQIISNCDASSHLLDHPADLYDYHVYTRANDMFKRAAVFDHASRAGPKAFVSEYAVLGEDAQTGSVYAAIAEAGFLLGLENNSDIVHMICYAPLFVNTNNRRWIPDAIVFNSYQNYGTPSYWVQLFFRESSGATLLKTSLLQPPHSPIVASSILWHNSIHNKIYLRIKVVNFGVNQVKLNISFDGLDPKSINFSGSIKNVLTSADRMDENSFSQPNKVVPIQSPFQIGGNEVNATILPPISLSSFDFEIV